MYVPGNDSAYIDPSNPATDQSECVVRAASPHHQARKMDALIEGRDDEHAPSLVWKKHGKKPGKGKTRNVHPYTTHDPGTSSNAASSSYLFGNAESEGRTELHSLVSDPYRLNQVGKSQTPLDMHDQRYPSMFEEPSRNSSELGDGYR